jgi:hypothetical protein
VPIICPEPQNFFMEMGMYTDFLLEAAFSAAAQAR